jgi:hypothetical protein
MDKALIDRDANGGICGDDMVVLEGFERFVDVFGLAGHKVSQLRIVAAQALIATHKGNIIDTFHQMELLGKGKSVLSFRQMEPFGADINDRHRSLPGGKQRVLMDGYQIPLQFKNGLAYLLYRKPTEEELGLLPHEVMTSDVDWDPSLYDNVIDGMDYFHDPTLVTMTTPSMNMWRNDTVPLAHIHRLEDRKSSLMHVLSSILTSQTTVLEGPFKGA